MTTKSKKAETSDTTTVSEAATPTTGFAAVLKLLDQVVALLGLSAVQNLTAKQRRAATRSRKGMEKVVPTLATLSAQHGVSVPKQETSDMTSKMALAAQLDTVAQRLTGITTLVVNNSDAERSAAWTTASILYGMMQPVAKRDPELDSQLEPVKQFFAYRTPAAKKAHPKSKAKKAALAAAKASTASSDDDAAATTTDTGTQAAASVPETAAVTKGA